MTEFFLDLTAGSGMIEIMDRNKYVVFFVLPLILLLLLLLPPKADPSDHTV